MLSNGSETALVTGSGATDPSIGIAQVADDISKTKTGDASRKAGNL
ncbi:hypothetical protein [Microcoleus sp. FACHB-831]|nr:hypothetical protein [Microcoleus sp. FACHB-831]